MSLAYVLTWFRFSAIGMITAMAEECGDATVRLPRALALCVPVGCIAGLFFVSRLILDIVCLLIISRSSQSARPSPLWKISSQHLSAKSSP
jgi:hypothetical protein